MRFNELDNRKKVKCNYVTIYLESVEIIIFLIKKDLKI